MVEVPINVEEAATEIIKRCREEQSGEVIVPIAAIDEDEMGKRLDPESTDQSVWDETRSAIAEEITSRGYIVDGIW